MIDDYSKDFLIQEDVIQHPTLSAIYEHSLNTIRIVTIKNNKKIHCISSVIRFGNDGNITDNSNSGGITCGIDFEGKIKSYATILNMNKLHRHPFNNKKFSGVQLPNYDNLKDFVKEMHKKLHYFDIVSRDIAIDKDGEFKMIEYNLRGQEINFHQINNGPLFGDYTTRILKRVNK